MEKGKEAGGMPIATAIAATAIAAVPASFSVTAVAIPAQKVTAVAIPAQKGPGAAGGSAAAARPCILATVAVKGQATSVKGADEGKQEEKSRMYFKSRQKLVAWMKTRVGYKRPNRLKRSSASAHATRKSSAKRSRKAPVPAVQATCVTASSLPAAADSPSDGRSRPAVQPVAVKPPVAVAVAVKPVPTSASSKT